MPERFLILLVLLSGIFFLLRKWFISKPAGTINFFDSSLQIPGINPDFPTIIYFWTEQCSQCFSLQNPALNKLKHNYSDFNLVSLNALDEEIISKKFNIKTVPSTAVISPENEVKFINIGFTGEDMLASQLKEVSTD